MGDPITCILFVKHSLKANQIMWLMANCGHLSTYTVDASQIVVAHSITNMTTNYTWWQSSHIPASE